MEAELEHYSQSTQIRLEKGPEARSPYIPVLNLTGSPFSDKLAMDHIGLMNTSGVANYGVSIL